MSKKKFKDTKVGQFLLEKIPNIVGSIAGDTPVGSVIKTLISGSEMSNADKEIALKKLEQEIHEFDGITRAFCTHRTHPAQDRHCRYAGR